MLKPYSSVYNKAKLNETSTEDKLYIVEAKDLFSAKGKRRKFREADAPAADNTSKKPNDMNMTDEDYDEDMQELNTFVTLMVKFADAAGQKLSSLKILEENPAGVQSILAPIYASAELAMLTAKPPLFNDCLKATQKYSTYINKMYNKLKFRGKIAGIAKKIGAKIPKVASAFGSMFKAVGNAIKTVKGAVTGSGGASIKADVAAKA